MKKTLFIIGIVFVIMIASMTGVYASTGKITLIPSSTQVKQGDQFTITLHAECADGINGVFAEFDYDTNVLDLVSGQGISTNDESENWVNQKASKVKIEVIDQRDDAEEGEEKPHIKNADIYVLTFKVKENATVGTTTSINAKNVKIDSDIKEESEFDVESQEVKISIVENAKNPDTPTNTSANPSGSSSTAKPTTSTTGTSAKTTDKTTASSVLPKTGLAAVTGIALVVIIAVAIVIFKKLKKYDGIE